MFAYKLLFGSIVIGGLLLVRGVEAEGPAVVINELMWMGSGVSSTDEWVELRNTTDQVVDISSWKLTKKSSGVEKPMVTIPAGRTIPPGGIFLISHFGSGGSSALAASPDLVSTDVSLVNSSLQIKLYDAAGVVMDTADDGTGNPLAGRYDSANHEYASMERNSVAADGALATSWHTAETTVGFLLDRTEKGTPGQPNSNGRPVAEAGSDVSVAVGDQVQFDGSGSSDPEKGELTYTWDFGDGTTATGVTATHAYAAVGVYTVALKVSDGIDEATDSAVVTVTEKTVTTKPTTTVTAPATPSASPAVPSSCRGLMLSTILPNPVGADTAEYIVVQNTTTETIDPNGCRLTVGTHSWTVASLGLVAGKASLTLPPTTTHLSLVNAGATVSLLDVDGTVLDTTTYGPAAEGRRWVKKNGKWSWTGAVKSTTKSTTKTKAVKEVHQLTTLADLQSLSSGDLVRARGTVTVPIGAFGEKQAIIEDATAGAAIVLVAPLPKISIGDIVAVSGTARTANGRRRIAVSQGGLRIVGHAERTARTMAVDNLGHDDADRLVSIHGVVTAVSGSRFDVDDGSDIVTATIKSSTGIVRPRLSVGDSATVVGVVAAGSTGLRVYPRIAADIVISRVLGAATAAPPQALKTAAPHQTWWYWGAVIVGLLAASGKKIWRWLAQRKTGQTELDSRGKQ